MGGTPDHLAKGEKGDEEKQFADAWGVSSAIREGRAAECLSSSSSPGREASEGVHPHRQLGSAGFTSPRGSSAGTKHFLQVAQKCLEMAQICAPPAQCAGSLLS